MGEARGGYERERVKLTAAHIKRAKTLIANGAVPGRGCEFADTESAGLLLRVTRRSGTWFLKHRAGTVRLADMDALPVAAAREAAERARVAVREGRTGGLAVDLATWEEAHRRGMSVDDARDAAFPEALPQQTDGDRRRDGPWNWADLIDLHLEQKLPTLSTRWAPQYEGHLRRAGDDLLSRPASSVDLEDLVSVRDRVAREHTASAAADTVEAVKSALDWAWRHHAPRAGLTHVQFPWWRERLTAEFVVTPREHTPTVEELVRTLVIAERYRALGGTAKETSPGILAALWGVVLTGQRAGALTGTLRATSRAWPDRAGWALWTWTGPEMKGRTPHAIPVPPEALAAVARHRVDPASPYLFPSRVPGRSVTAVGLTQFLDRLQGKTKASRQGGVTLRPEADLLAAHGIRPWTPHDVRRTMAALLDLERLGGAASAILAHRPPRAKGEPGQEREFAAAITLRHYLHSQRLELKAEGMQVWTFAVLEAYAAEADRFNG
jgi:integrase